MKGFIELHESYKIDSRITLISVDAIGYISKLENDKVRIYLNFTGPDFFYPDESYEQIIEMIKDAKEE